MLDARYGGDALHEAIVEGQSGGGIDPGPIEIHGRDEHAVAVEAEGHGREPLEGAKEESRRHDEHERQRDLRDDQPARERHVA